MFGDFLPYTQDDISIVIPQVSQYKNRISWFIPQYVTHTPLDLLNRTVVIYDEGDDHTRDVLQEFNINGITVPVDLRFSTTKILHGLRLVKTRLFLRIHNDAEFYNKDWASSFLNIVNEHQGYPVMVGNYHWSGVVGGERQERFQKEYPYLTFNPNGVEYLHGFFIGGQTYAMRGIYELLVETNLKEMDKEDALLTQMAASNNIKIVDWTHMTSEVRHSGKDHD